MVRPHIIIVVFNICFQPFTFRNEQLVISSNNIDKLRRQVMNMKKDTNWGLDVLLFDNFFVLNNFWKVAREVRRNIIMI